MSFRYKISHTTVYDYQRAVSISHNEARLTPRATPNQSPERTQILIEPGPSAISMDTDYFGNSVTFFALEEAHERLSVTALSEVDLWPSEPPSSSKTPPWEHVLEHLRNERDPETLEALDYAFESPHVRVHDELMEYARVSFTPGRPLLDAALELTQRIYREFEYEPGVTSVATPALEVLRTRRGVCQDFAHMQIAMFRALGIPARYVSGYVRTHPPAGRERLVGADASHAWLAVYCPGSGFVDVDPTNGLMPSFEHVTLAWGRDFSDVTPLKGVILGGGEHRVSVSVDLAE